MRHMSLLITAEKNAIKDMNQRHNRHQHIVREYKNMGGGSCGNEERGNLANIHKIYLHNTLDEKDSYMRQLEKAIKCKNANYRKN